MKQTDFISFLRPVRMYESCNSMKQNSQSWWSFEPTDRHTINDEDKWQMMRTDDNSDKDMLWQKTRTMFDRWRWHKWMNISMMMKLLRTKMITMSVMTDEWTKSFKKIIYDANMMKSLCAFQLLIQ